MLGSKTSAPVNIFICIIIISVLLQGQIFAQVVVEKGNDSKVMLWMEAEAGNITLPMKVFDNNDASGGQFIEVQGGNNNTENAPEDEHITYKFTIENAGTYKVWGRVIASMDDEDAFWVKMDNEEWVKWNDISVGCNWHWDVVHDNENNNQVMKFNLNQGPHILTFTYLMDQTRLDKLLITNDLNYIPTEIGPRVKALFKMSSNKPVVGESVDFDGSESAGT